MNTIRLLNLQSVLFFTGCCGWTSGGLFIITLSEHEVFETLEQIFDEIRRTVILVALHEALYAVAHILGRDLNVERFAVEGTFAEAFAHFQGNAEHGELGLVHRPVEGSFYLGSVFFRHEAEKVAVLMEFHEDVIVRTVDGG